jgi:hypothetical protein
MTYRMAISVLLRYGATWEKSEKFAPKNRMRTSSKQLETWRGRAGRLRAE